MALHVGAKHIAEVTPAPVPSDHVEAIRKRDPRVIDMVARENLDPLVRAAQAAGLGYDEAWDTAQDALLVFVQKADQYDGRASVRTWLFGILYRKVLERRRTMYREEPVDDLDAVLEARFSSDGTWTRPPRSPESYAAVSQTSEWLAECLAGLPDRRRLAFVLREVEQLDTEEICKILEISANNLGVLLFRARNALRECMEARGLHGSDDVAM